jgi:hypothetical protein
MPAQEAKWAAAGKRVMSAPISAMITSAVRRPTPGMVCSRRDWSAKGVITRSTMRAAQAQVRREATTIVTDTVGLESSTGRAIADAFASRLPDAAEDGPDATW